MTEWEAMPLERAVRWLMGGRWWEGGRYWTLPLWAPLEAAVILGLLVWLEGIPWAEAMTAYGVTAVLGMIALNLDIYLAFSTWDRARASLPRLAAVIADVDGAKCRGILDTTVFSRSWLIAITGACIVFGQLTFVVLGLSFSSEAVDWLARVALLFIFSSLGYVIATALGVWRAIYKVSRLSLQISVFHPDEVGGTKFLGDLALRLFKVGAVLVVVWSLAAHYSPYESNQLQRYAYWWVGLAVGLLAYSVFAPTVHIHRALVAAKTRHSEEVATLYEDLYQTLIPNLGKKEGTLEHTSNALDIIGRLDEKVQILRVWPYNNPVRTVLSVSTLEVLAIVLGMVAKDSPVGQIVAGFLGGSF